MFTVAIRSGARLYLNWIYRVNREGKRIGEAHLIHDDPETLTLCGIRTDNRYWESVGVTLDVDIATGIAEPGCHRCARVIAPRSG